MAEPTPEMIAMARRIHAEHDPDKAYQYLDGSRDDYPAVKATLAAIIETTELAAKFAETIDPLDGPAIAALLRAGDHLKGQDHG